MTHEGNAKSLYTMINVHPITDLSRLEIRRQGDSFRMSVIVVLPRVLPDEILVIVSDTGNRNASILSSPDSAVDGKLQREHDTRLPRYRLV